MMSDHDATDIQNLDMVAPAMDDLVKRYRRPLIAFFGTRAGYDLAEEMAQDTFLRFIAAGYDTSAQNAEALLFTIAANQWNDHLRKLRRERSRGLSFDRTLDTEEALNVAADQPLPDQEVEARETLARVLAAIDDLPPKCAQTFLLHRIQGKAHKEIADELGISISMVEKHIRRALIGLMAAMENE